MYLVILVTFNKISCNMYNSISNIWDEIQPYSQKQSYFLVLVEIKLHTKNINLIGFFFVSNGVGGVI